MHFHECIIELGTLLYSTVHYYSLLLWWWWWCWFWEEKKSEALELGGEPRAGGRRGTWPHSFTTTWWSVYCSAVLYWGLQSLCCCCCCQLGSIRLKEKHWPLVVRCAGWWIELYFFVPSILSFIPTIERYFPFLSSPLYCIAPPPNIRLLLRYDGHFICALKWRESIKLNQYCPSPFYPFFFLFFLFFSYSSIGRSKEQQQQQKRWPKEKKRRVVSSYICWAAAAAAVEAKVQSRVVAVAASSQCQHCDGRPYFPTTTATNSSLFSSLFHRRPTDRPMCVTLLRRCWWRSVDRWRELEMSHSRDILISQLSSAQLWPLQQQQQQQHIAIATPSLAVAVLPVHRCWRNNDDDLIHSSSSSTTTKWCTRH